jgi:hypothetical protein
MADYLADMHKWRSSSMSLKYGMSHIIEKLSKPSVKSPEEDTEAAKQDLMVIDEAEHEPTYDWMKSIKMFLENQLPSDDNVEVECIMRKSKMYHLNDGVLFR